MGHDASAISAAVGDIHRPSDPEQAWGDRFPIFPTFYWPISRDLLNHIVERLVDRAVSPVRRREATQEQFDAWSRLLGEWVQTVELED